MEVWALSMPVSFRSLLLIEKMYSSEQMRCWWCTGRITKKEGPHRESARRTITRTRHSHTHLKAASIKTKAGPSGQTQAQAELNHLLCKRSGGAYVHTRTLLSTSRGSFSTLHQTTHLCFPQFFWVNFLCSAHNRHKNSVSGLLGDRENNFQNGY